MRIETSLVKVGSDFENLQDFRSGLANWNAVYSNGEQLNRFPYTDVVSFFFRNLCRRSNLTALDVGTGSGVHANFLAEMGCKVFAFDQSPEAVRHASVINQHQNITYRCSSLEEMNLEGLEIDVVVDRLSSTHSSKSSVHALYSNLPNFMTINSKLFWQGFSFEHSDRRYGQRKDDYWSDFSQGMFVDIAPVVFFTEAEVREIFKNYRIDNIFHDQRTILSDSRVLAWWTVEATLDA